MMASYHEGHRKRKRSIRVGEMLSTVGRVPVRGVNRARSTRCFFSLLIVALRRVLHQAGGIVDTHDAS